MKFHNESTILTAATTIRECRANPVESLTPVNLDACKKAFIEAAGNPFAEQLEKEKKGDIGRTTFPAELNPKFLYSESLLSDVKEGGNRMAEALTRIRENVKPENDKDEAVFSLIKKRTRDAIQTANAASSILEGDDEGAKESLNSKYDSPSSDMCAKAFSLYREQSKLTAAEKASLRGISAEDRSSLQSIEGIDAEQLKRLFTRAMLYLNIDPWKVEISGNCAAIDVRDFSASGIPTVFIPETRKVTGTKAAELICHEIFCHLRGSDNGQKFFAKILRETALSPLVPILAKSDNETLYEGVAKISDVFVNGGSSLPDPLTLVAIDLANHGCSFADVAYQVYKMRLEAGAAEDKALTSAWAKTYRIFRGATDTATNKWNYAYPKDAAYFLGYEQAKTLKECESDGELFRLYASMEAVEIQQFDKLFLEFGATPRRIPFSDLVKYAIDIVLEE